MKTIIVCEGKKDLKFLKCLIEELGHDPEREISEYNYPRWKTT